MNEAALVFLAGVFLMALLLILGIRALTWRQVCDWFRRLGKAADDELDEANKRTMFNQPTTEHWSDEEIADGRTVAIMLAVAAVVLALLFA